LSELRKYLELVPRLTWLNLSLEDEDFEDNDQSQLDLKELRELKVECHFSEDLLKFLTCLPPNVLTKLVQQNNSSYQWWDALKTLLSNQRNIKQLSICTASFKNIPESLIDCLDLECLIWEVMSFENDDPELKSNERDIQVLVYMSSKQKNLTHLKMINFNLNDSMLKTLTNSLKKLEVFAFDFSNLSAEGVKVIEKPTKLKELVMGRIMNEDKNDVLRSLAELDNSRLEVLKFIEMRFPFYAPSNVIADIARSAPILKHLLIDRAKNFEVLLAVMQNFRRIELLKISPMLKTSSCCSRTYAETNI
jgi:hypothetical protein